MLIEATCSKRKCIHYIGVIQPDETEQTECHSCKAYLTGIPIDIVLGKDLHLKKRLDQSNDMVFEETKK